MRKGKREEPIYAEVNYLEMAPQRHLYPYRAFAPGVIGEAEVTSYIRELEPPRDLGGPIVTHYAHPEEVTEARRLCDGEVTLYEEPEKEEPAEETDEEHTQE